MRWLVRNGLKLAVEKTESVMLIRKWVYSSPVVHVGGHRVPFGRTIRYLSFYLDTRWGFAPHVREVTARTSTVSA